MLLINLELKLGFLLTQQVYLDAYSSTKGLVFKIYFSFLFNREYFVLF